MSLPLEIQHVLSRTKIYQSVQPQIPYFSDSTQTCEFYPRGPENPKPVIHALSVTAWDLLADHFGCFAALKDLASLFGYEPISTNVFVLCS